MKSPSARPWLGAGAALSALPAAGGCFCAALVLAVVVDSDPHAVYEQHRWLGAVVGASAVCAFVSMMGWATLRHGGIPLPVLLMALAVAGLPFLLPRSLFLPAAALAVAGCAVLVTSGLAHPPATPDATRITIAVLGTGALVLAVGQAVAVGVVGATSAPAPRAQVLADAPHHSAARQTVRHKPTHHRTSSPAKPGGTDAARAPEDPASAGAVPRMPAPADAPAATPQPAVAGATAPVELAPDPVDSSARRFVRTYYAALNARRFTVAWGMLSPEVQRRFGGFAEWSAGYAHSVSHSPGEVTVTPLGTGATVGLTLRAGDRGACGATVERRFAVTWRLARTAAGLRATAAGARKLSGPEPC